MYIYIYIYCRQVWVNNLKNNFIVKGGHETFRWGFFMFQCFLSFLMFAFFCLGFPSLPLLVDIFKPSNGPPNEMLGICIYIYSEVRTVRFWTNVCHLDG